MRKKHGLAWLLALSLLGGVASGCDDGRDRHAAAAQEHAVPAPADAAQAEQAGKRLCEHRVPAELCTQCNPELVEVFRELGDWCGEHGVPESQCFECRPGLTFASDPAAPADWCREHSVPESRCTKCDPSRISGFIEADNYCREHGFPQDICPFCHPELVRAAGRTPPGEAPLSVKVRLASVDTAADAGIETRTIRRRPFVRMLDVVGRLAFNQNRLAKISARGDALILEVKSDLGAQVAAGDALLVLASASVGEEQAKLSSARAQVAAALANVERETRLSARGISPRRSLEEAQSELARAQAQYDEARSSLGAAGATATDAGGRYVLSAPFGGTVVSRNAVAGRSVDSGELLMEVADLSVFWALLDVPEADAGDLKAGQDVALSLEGGNAKELHAAVTRVADSVDEKTRTVQVRVELENPERRLKAGTYVRARIEVGDEHEAIVVPRESIQKAEGRTVVFVRKDAVLFEPVTVQVKDGGGDEVEVTGALADGDEVVTTGAFLLKTEILKDSIGAGCCDEGGE